MPQKTARKKKKLFVPLHPALFAHLDALASTDAAQLSPFVCPRLAGTYPPLAPVYAMKEEICQLLCLKTLSKQACRQRIPDLLRAIRTLRESGLQAALTLAAALSDWQEEIVRMWRFSRNNGITEGFHRKMKLIQRRAYGFRSFNNYRLRVIAQCG